MKRFKIKNGNIITPYRVIKKGSVIIENGKIIYVGDKNIDVSECDEFDAEGNYISPGFIDIHTHGAGGHDFMDGTVEAYLGAAKMHAQHGTTSLVPTTLTSTNEALKHTFSTFKKAKALNTKGSNMLGLHLEGPYFSMKQKGAQDSRYIKKPTYEEYKEILTWSDDIIRWSAAPELEGACNFGSYIKSKGILPSIGHTDAVYEEVQKAFEHGFTHITHLYSAMSGVKRINAYRYSGVVESAYLIDEMTVEIISDGCHLPASLLQLVYKIKGPSRIALITDSMRAAGMPEGESILGSLKDGQKVIVEKGVAKLMDQKAFAGSVATSDRLVRTMVKKAGIPIIDAVQMMTSTPARIMDYKETKGKLAQNMDADIVIFDEEINIKMTMVKGKIIYHSEPKETE